MQRYSVMKAIPILLCVGIISFSSYLLSAARNRTSSEFTQPTPAVYISSQANKCANFEGEDYWVFIYAPDMWDLVYVSFDADLGFATPPVITPGDGVYLDATNVSGSLYHFEAFWTFRALDHAPIIKIHPQSDPSLNAIPYDVVFQDGHGNATPGYGMYSLSCCTDLFDCWVAISAESHAYVPIGATTKIPFQWYWACWNVGGGSLSASDTEGWVVSWAPTSAGGEPTFGLCIVPVFDGWVEVSVPEDVPVGTLSQLVISGAGDATVTLEADDSTPAVNTSWGAIKSLYR